MSNFDQSNQNVGTQFNAVGNINFINANTEQSSSHSVFNLPNLKETVYDREKQTLELLQALKGEFGFEEQFWLLVAPSGFGKTFLVTKALQNVTDGKIIKSEYEDKVKKILRFDCRATNSLAEIVSDFNEILGTKLEYKLKEGETSQNWLNKYLFPSILKVGTVWLLLDNFETWLKKDNTITNPEIQVFLNSLLEGNHSFRMLIVSQASPSPDIKKRVKELKNIGKELFKGLPETDALAYLQNEGRDVGLDKADEKLLKEFLERIYYIPQALDSLRGYLHTIEGYSFEEFMSDTNLWKGFDEYESETDDGNVGKRRTKALITKQIFAQTIEVQFILGIISFYKKPMPQLAIELLFSDKTIAAKSISRLTSNRLAIKTVDFYNIPYYELHTYILEQSIEQVIPRIEIWFTSRECLLYVKQLYEIGLELLKKSLLRLSIDLLECAESAIRIFIERTPNSEAEPILATILLYKGGALDGYLRSTEATTSYDEAVEILRKAIYQNNKQQWKQQLANTLQNNSIAFSHLGYFYRAYEINNEAVKIYRSLLKNKRGDYSLLEYLASGLMNQGNYLSQMERFGEALDFFDESILIRRKLLRRENRLEIRDVLAASLSNKGTALSDLKRVKEANDCYEEAIQIRRDLVEIENNEDRLNKLATVCSNFASFVEKSDILGALNYSAQAIKYRKIVVLDFRVVQHLPELLLDYYIHIKLLIKEENWGKIAITTLDAGAIFFGHSKEDSLSQSIKENAYREFIQIKIIIRGVAIENREKIYAEAGEYGTYLREFIED